MICLGREWKKLSIDFSVLEQDRWILPISTCLRLETSSLTGSQDVWIRDMHVSVALRGQQGDEFVFQRIIGA